MSARDRIRQFFLRNIGKKVTTHEIRKIAAISEYARRIRELRNDEGYQILSHQDRPDQLRPGEYLLETDKREPVIGSGVSPQLRIEILERNGYTCRLCGATAGDPDPFNPHRTLRLHVDHIKPRSQRGTSDPANLRVLCSACNAGKSNIDPPRESALNLLALIRKADTETKRQVYEALKKMFGG